MKKKFTSNGHNEVLEGKDFYISYNPNTAATSPIKWGNDGEETALVIQEDDKPLFLILKGDWRKEYLDAFPSLTKCRAIYEKNEGRYASVWTKR